MKALKDSDCETCVKLYEKSGRKGLHPEPAWTRAACPSCGKFSFLCRAHYPVWVACSDECKAAWKKRCSEGLPKDPMTGPPNPRERKPKGVAVHQADMFTPKMH